MEFNRKTYFQFKFWEKINYKIQGVKMSKVSQKCPICDGNFIVIMLNENTKWAWPECWKCGFSGHSPEDKEAMSIDLDLNSHMTGIQLFKEAASSWNEYLTLLEEENNKQTKDN